MGGGEEKMSTTVFVRGLNLPDGIVFVLVGMTPPGDRLTTVDNNNDINFSFNPYNAQLD